MKDMLASFKHKVAHGAAEESETVSLEVDPSNDHPLDDADKAGYDPRFTEASIHKHAMPTHAIPCTRCLTRTTIIVSCLAH